MTLPLAHLVPTGLGTWGEGMARLFLEPTELLLALPAPPWRPWSDCSRGPGSASAACAAGATGCGSELTVRPGGGPSAFEWAAAGSRLHPC